MGRRKQPNPHRAATGSQKVVEAELDDKRSLGTNGEEKIEEEPVVFNHFLEVDRSNWGANEHLDISEVVLTDLKFGEDYCSSCFKIDDSFYHDTKYHLRFRVTSNELIPKSKFGHQHLLLSSSDISLEFIEVSTGEDKEVILSGSFDGPDEGLSGLIHLVRLKFVTLRPVVDIQVPFSVRIRVELLKQAFDACDSLLDSTRQKWYRSMTDVMAWLRPEVVTSEARYRISTRDHDLLGQIEDDDTCNSRKQVRFDVAEFYEAIKPSKTYPMLEDKLADLLPTLRPYQCRAAHWMVQRERGSRSLDEKERDKLISPMCIPIDFLDAISKMFYNPFSGNVSLHHPVNSSTYVFGGILADEMGLGKTVELLSCILTHQKPASESAEASLLITENQKMNLKRVKQERVECTCGAVSESRRYMGTWVQCDVCDAWQHADCVGYSSGGKTQKWPRKKATSNIVEKEEDYICQLCLELIQLTSAPIPTAGTLIVCPAPILPQWHAEILRHTRPGSLKTYIYDGVSSNRSDTSVADINEVVSADIVLTTYDVLRHDLSHDSDRHERDRRLLRYQKRYPVVPTPLTRISWWRICLDEAQMVENAGAATEMAMRLHAKYRWCITGTPIQRKLDDLYGLVRFLKASPFDVSRWWTEVIRDPYERREPLAIEFTHDFFKEIMWRSSKLHVMDELQLPPQVECVSWLTFSPTEEHFYQRQHETCVHYAHEVIRSLKDDILKRKVPGSFDDLSDTYITHMEAAKLLNSLLKLRQACCHPQVGSSGLRTLQQSPMTMDEILQLNIYKVLVGKTKTEGEEALRKVIVALNALAGIAMIEKNPIQAKSLYQEAVHLTEAYKEDFRVDPLLNIHVHHNLAESLTLISSSSDGLSSKTQKLPETTLNAPKFHQFEKFDRTYVKRRKLSVESSSDSDTLEKGSTGDPDCLNEISLRTGCENLKIKYLSVFSAKLFAAQQEFKKSCTQVCAAFNERKTHQGWWLEVLHHVEKDNNLSRDMICKIEEAVVGTLNTSKPSKSTSRFQSVPSLKYHIQAGLDKLEASRKILIDRLLEIDRTMEKPKEEDFERVRNCPRCYDTGDGPLCILCELDKLFQEYEARLFRLNTPDGGFTSVEDAVHFQKKMYERDRKLFNLQQPGKTTNPSSLGYIGRNKRDAVDKISVSKCASNIEIALGVIKSYGKAKLGRDGMLAAANQLHILEGMRKEYGHARSLSIAQAQFLSAHDEIKMATLRFRLRDDENDISIDALSLEELPTASVLHTSEKFMAVSLLSSIKGKLRYLKTLVQSNKKSPSEGSGNSSLTQELATMSTSDEDQSKTVVESCPICHEKIDKQKMVFPCGHVTCCKCLLSLTERRLHDNIKWVMCPICRQPTDVRNISYADDSRNKSHINKSLASEDCEASLIVQGSYGTKIEAITRRILWIKSTDPDGKVLIFSSWNDVLDVLEHAFSANEVTYIRMKGGRKSQIGISEFRKQSFQVLLLLIQHGANGLNLLEAKHVVLVEPLLNPAVEAQAISRVHRIGQQNTTLVHRFMVKNTVEESVYKLNRSRNCSSIISGNTKNQDQPLLTVKDVESLFSVSTLAQEENENMENLRDLPPSMAAVIAAERRLKEQASSSS
ncbi:hypothetical protein ACFE04_030130 [Oxalis oulophora]